MDGLTGKRQDHSRQIFQKIPMGAATVGTETSIAASPVGPREANANGQISQSDRYVRAVFAIRQGSFETMLATRKPKLMPLLAASAELDRRIAAMAANPVGTITPEQVRDILIRFGQGLRQQDLDFALYSDLRHNPLLVVNKGIAESKDLEAGSSLSLYNISQLKLVEFLFSEVEQRLNLHSKTYNLLQVMQFGFARSLLQTPEDLFLDNHPVRRYFVLAIDVASRCDDANCHAAMSLLETLYDTMLSAITSPQAPGIAFSVALEELERAVDEHHHWLDDLHEKLVRKERSQRKLHDVRHTVHDVISKACEGKRLPTFALTFLHEMWSKYLYITYLRLGVESPQWREGISDMYQLIWSLVTRSSDELNRRMAGPLSEALRRIKRHTQSVHQAVEVDNFFNTLAEVQTRIIEGDELDDSLFYGWEEVSRRARENEERNTSKPNLSAEVLSATSGEWFIINHHSRIFPGQLIENSDEGYLLFADYCGNLGAKFTYDEFTAAVRGGEVRPLERCDHFEIVLEEAVGRLDRYIGNVAEQVARKEQEIEDRHQREAEIAHQRELERQKLEQKKREEQERLEQERRAQQAEAERQERIRQELELKRQIEEETRRQEEAARQEAERRAEAERLAREQALREAMQDAEKLEPGGMVELTDEAGNPSIVSLSLRLKRTGKLVFTDRTGRRQAEFLPEEFGDHLLRGTARIIDYRATGDKRLDDLRWTRLTETIS